ncbi:tRNA-dihydrouridine synthase 3 [Coniochaeta pulveracea]|uniref:tRNA-dihydrouridine(47) synthase [NAD(P)(+)] n=1 Tax=Coniochaeta pulveracea TaxID=177199 RepID=A0A420Y9N2_9PEZI|nr:tRNA-dihydrouridine synthase 3 [Coniochaeta pulveracea]
MEPLKRQEPTNEATGNGVQVEPAAKRVKLDSEVAQTEDTAKVVSTVSHTEAKVAEGGDAVVEEPRVKRKGHALIKEEFLIPATVRRDYDDDAAEVQGEVERVLDSRDAPKDGKKKKRGQNKEREFGRFADQLRLCNSRAHTPEFSPRECPKGDKCNALHDLRKYLEDGRRGDLDTFNGICPVFETYGRCYSGWPCRFVKSHMEEVEHEDGRKELVLAEDPTKKVQYNGEEDEMSPGVVNVVSAQTKIAFSKRKINLDKSDQYVKWLERDISIYNRCHQKTKEQEVRENLEGMQEYRAQFVEPPLRASEKRRLYFGPETPVLAPLTTQGNLPFRRLCVELGAQVTYSEMALGLPLLQGQKADWSVMKAHQTELIPPRVKTTVVDYDNFKDIKFGAQIAAHAPWIAIKSAEALSRYLPHLREININCGCPIDMLFKSGAGSALMDAPSKLERMVRGMNVVSGDVPITVKIRTGVKDGKPTAAKLIERLAFGSVDQRDLLGAPGTAAITLHGRSRQQRYTKEADWGYIAECAALIKSYHEKKDDMQDTIREAEENTLANSLNGKMYFIGNGDCYSHVDYYDHIEKAKVDSVMIGRGAIIKPWIFEEIEKGQYLDKSASERLTYIEKFCRYGMEAWGSDELGIGYTRRFLLEFLSFFYRYVPVGVLDHLPPSLNDRPPAYRGRDDLETLLASDNYKDWIKISEMFLGPAHPDFKFQPKHKSNSYEIDAEG